MLITLFNNQKKKSKFYLNRTGQILPTEGKRKKIGPHRRGHDPKLLRTSRIKVQSLPGPQTEFTVSLEDAEIGSQNKSKRVSGSKHIQHG